MKEILKKIRKLSDQTLHNLKFISKEGCSKDLAEEDLRQLMKLTALEEKEILSKYELFLKDHPSGEISRETFNKILRKSLCKNRRNLLRYE